MHESNNPPAFLSLSGLVRDDRILPETRWLAAVINPAVICLFIGVIGVMTLAISLLLFLQPFFMIRIWPWMLTPLTARVVGAMFALLGVLGLCIALEPRWSAPRLLLEAHACSIAMILIAAAVRLQVRQPQGSTALVSAALNHCNKWVHHESMEVTLAPSLGTRDCPMNAMRFNRDRHSGGIESVQGEDAKMIDVNQAIVEILARREQIPMQRSVLAGISGIDGSGKGYLTGQIVSRLQRQGQHAVAINADGWLNLPDKRFNLARPAQHFYEHAIRFDDMFTQLILPLKEKRTHDVVAALAEETAHQYYPHLYHFVEIDIIVLEGIYLFKRAYREYFDLAFWVECTFETALERALRRGQEGLTPDETIRAYQTLYFPAQHIHFSRDQPRTSADFLVNNDPRLLRCT